MNGPDHYMAAEVLLDDAPAFNDERALTIARAQVHATLALAAATALPAILRYAGDETGDDRAWTKVTGQ